MERRAGIILPLIILGAEDSPTEEEIEAYKEAHPRTHIVILFRRNCGEEGLLA
jgi:hypothetical protein